MEKRYVRFGNIRIEIPTQIERERCKSGICSDLVWRRV
jgi:hypothetical protein